MSRVARISWVVAAALCAHAGCGASDDAGAPGVALGLACDQLHPCEGELLCVDGVCRRRPWPPDAVVADTQAVPIDIAVRGGAGAADTEGAADTVGAVVGGVATDTAAGDTPGDAGASGEDGADDAGDAAGTIEVYLGEHTALTDRSDDALTLAPSQGVASQLVAPVAGQPVALEVLATDPTGQEGCGRYRPALWLGDPASGGAIGTLPAWEGGAVEVHGEVAPQRVPLQGAPALLAGGFRAGLIYEGLCSGATRQPLIATDASGITAQTWVWISLGEGATWVDAATLQLSGRWAIRLALEVAAR